MDPDMAKKLMSMMGSMVTLLQTSVNQQAPGLNQPPVDDTKFESHEGKSHEGKSNEDKSHEVKNDNRNDEGNSVGKTDKLKTKKGGKIKRKLYDDNEKQGDISPIRGPSKSDLPSKKPKLDEKCRVEVKSYDKKEKRNRFNYERDFLDDMEQEEHFVPEYEEEEEHVENVLKEMTDHVELTPLNSTLGNLTP